jgi:hypothetical protein
MSTLSNDVKFLTENVIIVKCYVYQLNCHTNIFFFTSLKSNPVYICKKKSHVKIEDQNCGLTNAASQRPKPKS